MHTEARAREAGHARAGSGRVAPGRSAVRGHVRRAALALAGLAVTVVVLHSVLGTQELAQAGRSLAHAAPLLIAVAVALEAISFLSYALAQRRLLAAAGRSVELRWLVSLELAAQSLSNFLPGGYLAANVVNFRELRRRGVPVPAVGWTLVASSALYIGTLAMLALLGSAIAGGASVLELAGGVLAALLVLALVVRRRGRVPSWAMPHLGGSSSRLARARAQLGDWRTELAGFRPTRRDAGAIVLLFAGCWIADAACLLVSFLATGSTPPWPALLLGYCTAQLASFVPITPGGVGLVEGSLTVMLVGSGHGAAPVLAAVLLYRLISYWSTLPLGAAGYALVRRGPAAGASPMRSPAPALTPAPAAAAAAATIAP